MEIPAIDSRFEGRKDTFFHRKRSLNVRGELVEIEEPWIMGILNLTPDSFYDGGAYSNAEKAIEQAGSMLDAGARIIDVGAASTKPGSAWLDTDSEWERLEPVLPELIKHFPNAWFSVDTYNAATARKSVEHGAALINDVSGGEHDPAMFDTIVELGVPYILMHLQGSPETMQQAPHYEDTVQEVMYSLAERVKQLHHMGVADVIIDPGFGFGKTVTHNYQLLRHLHHFALLEVPVLAGVSRKSMINRVLGTTPANALNGTTVLNTLALLGGADILRVHDVKEAVQCTQLVAQWRRASA